MFIPCLIEKSLGQFRIVGQTVFQSDVKNRQMTTTHNLVDEIGECQIKRL